MSGTKRSRRDYHHEHEHEDEDTPSFGREHRRKQSTGLLQKFGIWRGASELPSDKASDADGSRSNENAENIHPVQSRESSAVITDSQKQEESLIEICGITMPPIPQKDPKTNLPSFTLLPNLLSNDMGIELVCCTSQHFGLASNLIKSSSPSEDGDCWETRRRRILGHEWLLYVSPEPMLIHGIEIDSRGARNPAPQVSIDCSESLTVIEEIKSLTRQQYCLVKSQEECTGPNSIAVLSPTTQRDVEKIIEADPDSWDEILPISRLKPSSRNYFLIEPNCETWPRIQVLRVNIYPDGGIGRLRVYGERFVSPTALRARELSQANLRLNYASALLGAWPTWSSCPLATTQPLVFDDTKSHWLTPAQPFRNPVVVGASQDPTKPKFPVGPKVIISFPRRCHIQEILISTQGIIGDAPYGVEASVLNTTSLTRCSILEQIHFFKNVHIPSLSWYPVGTIEGLQEDCESALPLDHHPVIGTHISLSLIPDGRLTNVQVWGCALDEGAAKSSNGCEVLPPVSKSKRRNSTQLLVSSLAEAFS